MHTSAASPLFGETSTDAWARAGASLLFAVRLWASVCLALYVAFWLELDNAYWAGTTAAIVSQTKVGASLRKGWFGIIGTVVGATVIVVLTACFPQDRLAFLGLLALWGGLCALGATVLHNFASYAAALAGITAAIIASDTLGATGGASPEVFMLAVWRASEACIGIVCAGIVLAGTDFGGAPRRLAAQFAALSADIASGFASSLALAGIASSDTQQQVRRELIRRLIALDPVIDESIGESATLRYNSWVLQAASDGLFAALAAWRSVAAHLARLPNDAARQQVNIVLSSIPWQLRSAALPAGPASWMDDPSGTRRLCDAAVRRLLEMPAGAPSLRLLADQTAGLLAGFAAVLNGLALLVDDPARAPVRRTSEMLYVPDWLPALVSGGRAFVAIGAVEVFWVATAWPNGDRAIIFVAAVVMLLSPRGDLAYGASIGFGLGTAAAVFSAAVIKFAVLPNLGTFPGLCIAMGLVLVPVGFAMAHSRQPAATALFTATAIYFMFLVSPTNEMTYDTVQFYNFALAAVVGVSVAPLAFRLLPPLSPALRARRLLALTLRDLRRLATKADWSLPNWEGRIYSRLAALPDQAEPVQRARLMAALRVGSEIIRLRAVVPRLGCQTELASALEPLARGDSVAAIAQFAQLDRRLASVADADARGSVLRERARILLICDALIDHREYFDRE